MGGNTRVALTLFDRAASLDAPDWPPVLRAWMVGCRAEEHAALGHALESDRDMEAAHRAIAVTGVVHNPALDVASLDIVTTTAGLAGFIGACALALERHQEAAAIFQQGLDEAVSVGRLSGLAAVRALEEELEEACRLLTEALELAIQRDLPTRLRRVEGVRARYLSRWPEYPAVQEFDERFRLAVAS
jgi:tetratricopeptide (TPR) repeat protein